MNTTDEDNRGQGTAIKRGPSGILPLKTELRLIEQAAREGWLPGERREVIEAMLKTMRTSDNARDRAAAARVLATFERNQISAERNEIVDTNAQRQEQTAKLRAALATPEGRAAMTAATSAMLDNKSPEQESK